VIAAGAGRGGAHAGDAAEPNPGGPGLDAACPAPEAAGRSVDTPLTLYYHMLMKSTMRERLLQRKADLLKGLAQPMRLRILELLAEGERCVCEIQPAVGGEQSNVSKHLAFLRSRGLVVARRQGLRVFYRVADPGVLVLLREADRLLSRRLKADAELASSARM
jgi:DNA-binding transcriptional ArsR family regulator